MRDVKVTFPKPCDQPWDAMTPHGCHRHCAACDKVIHDLAALSVDEAEALLDSGKEVCVRARIGSDGVIATRGPRDARRLIAAAGASLALATAACQTLPDNAEPRYRITGKFPDKQQYYEARLISADGLEWPKKREPGTGRFIFDNLAPGTYTLTTTDNCGERQELRTITFSTDSVDVGKVYPDANESCVIIGVMMRR
jgi:hypothetical protein